MKMRYNSVLVMLLAITLFISPVFSFVHPPPPEIPCATFGVKINGEWCYNEDYAYNFTEPEDGYCKDVMVEVWALNMTDLYGYEFKLTWDPTYFTLKSWVVEKVWDNHFTVSNTTGADWFKLAVVAVAPSTGVDGDVKLATLTFHIINHVCWPQGMVSGVFKLGELKASDSCTDKIDLCDVYDGYWKFWAAEPEVYIQPEEEINCVVGETVTYSVWVHNITRMKSLHFDLRWKGNHIVNCRENIWLPILNITEKDVVINEEVFPKENRTSSIAIEDICVANETFRVIVDIVTDCDFPLINGTFKAVDLAFTKMDPWLCGRQPNYTKSDHVWTPENATTPLWFECGHIDVCCPNREKIYFGENHACVYASYNEAEFTFMTVSGDLTGDGKVDITDLTTIASKYGLTWTCCSPFEEWYAAYYHDFNKDGVIDIYDIIVVAKNYGVECPF